MAVTACMHVYTYACTFSPCCLSTSTIPYCSSKILTQDKEHFARLAVDAVLRLKGSSNLESIHIIKKTGGTLKVGACADYHYYMLFHALSYFKLSVGCLLVGWLACLLAAKFAKAVSACLLVQG